MPASPESASSSTHADAARAHDAVLICGVNWVGDSVMTMPALQAYRRAHPTVYITLLVKPQLQHLWRLHGVPNEVLPLKTGLLGTLRTAAMIRKRRFGKAYVLPHSFRSAVIPFFGGTPKRAGMPGHWRDFMLTQVIRPREAPDKLHQAWEYMDLLLPGHDARELELPALRVPDDAMAFAEKQLAGSPRPRVGMIPGAARGPAKRWPAQNFIEVGRLLSRDKGCSVVTLGISREAPLCEQVARGIGDKARNLAGQTSLAEWIAILKACDLVIANDSGGMHLAAAVGTPVAAIFGITDPAKTGPLGRACRVVQNSTVRNRDVERDSPEAIKSLASVTPEQVYQAALGLMDARDGKR